MDIHIWNKENENMDNTDKNCIEKILGNDTSKVCYLSGSNFNSKSCGQQMRMMTWIIKSYVVVHSGSSRRRDYYDRGYDRGYDDRDYYSRSYR